MTNSHNRGGRNGSQAERYFNNHSPHQANASSGKKNNTGGSGGGNGGRGQKSPSSGYFRSISTSNAIPIVQSSSPVSSKSGNFYSSSSPSGRHHSFNHNNFQRSSPGGIAGGSVGSFPGTLSASPPNFSHFAGSKCYDAPAPTALPKPPIHWTSSTSSLTVTSALTTSKRFVNQPSSMSVANTKSVNGGPLQSASSSLSACRSKAAKSAKPALSCAAAAAKANRNVEFALNLKTVLNVQA